jgi:hypothetical protein
MAGVIPYTLYDWKKTHADQIRSNTDKELANWLAGRACSDIDECPYIDQEVYGDDRDCGKCRLDWLKQEAKDG